MRYLSVCSGIEAATVAWKPLGFEPVAYSEIDPFCNTLLEYYYPNTPNIGDMRDAEIERYGGSFELLVGGTPCQSFSIAGKRGGLDDPRGRLVWEYIRFLDVCRPQWFVWENSCGVLTVNRGEDFKVFVSEIIKCGYSLCWRVLDGRDFATPQPRRRVFVVGHIGEDWRASAAVLFEPEVDNVYGEICEEEGVESPFMARTLGTKFRNTLSENTLIPIFNAGSQGARIYGVSGMGGATLSAASGGWGRMTGLYATPQGIRRLTPLESERYMGFPDGYTNIIYKGKPASDTQRYKALGNSIIPAKLRWIGERIKMWENQNEHI
jgi:DNA (cytosine-5)-methyltransferase 1